VADEITGNVNEIVGQIEASNEMVKEYEESLVELDLKLTEKVDTVVA